MFKTTDAATPEEYIDRLEEPRRTDVQAIHDLIRKVAPDLDARIESGMLAYGSYHYRYASGREGDWFPIAVASNKRYISLYVSAATSEHGYLAESYRETAAQGRHRAQLRPHQTPRGCGCRGAIRADSGRSDVLANGGLNQNLSRSG